jgi:hypothetical protein
MLVKTASLPSYDTTLIHVAAAAAIALADPDDKGQ